MDMQNPLLQVAGWWMSGLVLLLLCESVGMVLVLQGSWPGSVVLGVGLLGWC